MKSTAVEAGIFSILRMKKEKRIKCEKMTYSMMTGSRNSPSLYCHSSFKCLHQRDIAMDTHTDGLLHKYMDTKALYEYSLPTAAFELASIRHGC